MTHSVVDFQAGETCELVAITQYVPGAAHRLQQGRVEVPVDLGAQAAHVDVDHVGLGIEVVVPYVLQQHGAGDDLAGVAHQILQLQPREFRLLEYFLRRAGRALTRNDILDTVWGTAVIVTARSVDRCVTTLRAKIEPDPRHPTYIHTIRDVGYRFEDGL